MAVKKHSRYHGQYLLVFGGRSRCDTGSQARESLSEVGVVPEAKRFPRFPAALLLLALAGGVVFGFWMTVKAHDYYYPGRLHLVIREQDSTFKVEQAGQHELSYREDLGD